MKKAFTLIELIITIVIIGIAASALPTMIASANKLEEETINQDVFFKSITVVTDIASRYWDANILAHDDLGDGAMMVLAQNTSGAAADASLKQNPRPGNFGRTNFDFRQFYTTAPTTASQIPAGSGVMGANEQIESIDGYNGRFLDEITGGAKVRYDIAVAYVPDVVADNTVKDQTATWNLSGGNSYDGSGTPPTTTNLKRITVTASGRTVAGQPMGINFVYFSSNIGTPGIKKQ